MASERPPTPTLPNGPNVFGSFTRVSKGLSMVLAGTYLICWAFPAVISFFALLPGRTIPFAWNLITCGFLEISLVSLLVDVPCLLFLGRLLEPVWGTKEFIRFVVVVSLSTASSTFVLIFLVYCFTLQGWLLYTPIAGFHGVVAGLLVAIKQAMPDQELPWPLPWKLRAKWLPSLLVLLVLLRLLLLGQGLLYAPFIVFGTYNAWVYLRFYQARGDGSVRGDANEDFAFATFFPEALRPFVGAVATILGKLLCVRRTQAQGDAENLAAGMPLPGSHPLDSSRRRERGARALEERLSKAMESAASSEKPGNGGKGTEAKPSPKGIEALDKV